MLEDSLKSLRLALTKVASSSMFYAIKAEFEAEGTRFEELAILNSICSDLGIPLTLKIGGPLAQRDIVEALQLGASAILVPMVESSFIAKQSIGIFNSLNKSFGSMLKPAELYMNIETYSAVDECELIIRESKKFGAGGISTLVIGRSDLAASLDIRDIEGERIYSYAEKVVRLSSANNIASALGGNITSRSFENITRLQLMGLKFYETRKCTFRLKNEVTKNDYDASIAMALRFEVEWLRFKERFYEDRAYQDSERIKKIEERLEK